MRKILLSLSLLLTLSSSVWADFFWNTPPPGYVNSGQQYTVAVTATFNAQSVSLLLNKDGATVKGNGASSPTVAPVSVPVSYTTTDTATGSDSTVTYTAVANIYPAIGGVTQYTSSGTTRVIAPNTAPTVTWTVYPSDHKATAGQDFTIKAHATDADGNLVNIRITNFNTGVILKDTWVSACSDLDSPDVIVNQPTAADMRFRADAWDGKASSYADLSVVVGNPNHAPMISWVGTPPSGVVSNQSFTLQAKGTDVDGNLATVTVLRDDQPFSSAGAGDGYQSTSNSASYSQAALGSVKFSAEAVDASGVSSGKIYQIVNVNLATPNDSFSWNPATPPADPGAPSGASLIVGAATGSFEVDNKGSGNYTLPLKIAPGRGGFQPSLSLSYSSGGGNGPVGLGWSLSHGFPQKIQRGRNISARDGDTLSRGPNFDDNDKYYLDGKRLIRISGTEGAPNSEYRTEVDSFVKVKALGTGNNIDTFVVQYKNGHTYTFGKYSSSADAYQMGVAANETKAYAYAIKHAEDALGNSIDFNYTDVLNASGARLGEYVLAEIVYTGNPSLSIAGAARVRFQYNTLQVNGQNERPDRNISYVATRRFAQSRRLDSINVESDTGSGFSRVGYYRLEYDIAANGGNTRLLSLTPYLLNSSSNAFESLQKTTFDWTEASQVVSAQSPYSLPTKNGNNFAGYNPFAFGDFDGDGKEDYLDARTSLTVYLSTGAAFTAPQSWMSGASLPDHFAGGDGDGGGSVFVADVNGDGKKDLILATNNFERFYVVISNGFAFTGLDGSPNPTLIAGAGANQIGGVDITQLAFRDPPTGSQSTYQLLSAEKGGAGARVTVADFTGDGRDDLLLHGYDGYFYTLTSQGTSFGSVRRSTYATQPCSVQPVVEWYNVFKVVSPQYRIISNYTVRGMPVDINGDGLMDYAWVETLRSSPQGLIYTCLKQLKVAIALPGGNFTAPQAIDAQSLGGTAGQIRQEDLQYYVLPGDYNGDGMSDFLVLRGKNVSAPNQRWTLLRSRGTTAEGQQDFEHTPGILPDSLVVGSNAIPTVYSSVTPFGWTNFHLDIPFGGSNHPLLSENDPLFFAHAETSTDNTFAVDLNQDGLTDYIWYVASAPSNGVSPANKGWYVCYCNGTSFRSPVRLSGHPWDDIAPQPLDNNPNITWLSLSQRGDLNGDGISDWAYESSNPVKDDGLKGWFLSQGKPGNLITAITDGLNKKTEIVYSTIKDDAIYTQGVSVAYPITERRTGNPVVSDVYQDTGDASQRAQFSYQYSGNRIDLSGRGSLGFHSFVTLDRQTGLFKYQFLTQSFPMTGLAAREQTYRSWTVGSDLKFRIISSHDNTVVFDEVTDGTNSYGTVYPFISRAIESRWEDSTVAHFPYTAGGASSKPELLFPDYGAAKPAGAHITITAESLFDGQTAVQTTIPGSYNPSDTTAAGANSVNGYASRSDYNNLVFPKKITFGNLKQLQTDFGGGFSEKVATTYKAAPAGTNLTGLVNTVTTTTTSPGYATETAPSKTYSYKGSTPLVASEFVDASGATNGSSNLNLTTTYAYDDHYRLTSTSISSPDTTVGSYTVSSVTVYNNRFDLPTTVKDAYDHATTTGYDSVWGLPTSVTDFNNVQVATTYDALGRTVNVTRTAGGVALSTDTPFGWTTAAATDWKKTQTVSGPGGLTLTSAYAVHATATVQPSTTTYYDRLGRAIRTIKDGFGSQQTYTDTVYDVLGRVVASSLPYPSNGTALWTKTEYDPLGRVSKITAPNGTITINSYIGRSTQTTITPSGGTGQINTTYVDAKGRTVKVWNADNVPASINPSSGSTAEASIAYNLDGFGRMRETVLKGQTQKISATYDALGKQISLDDPDKGKWTYTNNALGQVTQQKDAVGNITNTTYDRLGRTLTRITTEVAGPIETASWFYYDVANDAAKHTVALGDRGWIGAVQREDTVTFGGPGYAGSASGTATVHYYNNRGLPTIDLLTIDGKWFYTNRDYDNTNRLIQVRHYWKPAGHESASDLPYMWQDFGYSQTYDTKSYLLSVQDTTGKVWWEANPTNGYDYLDRPVLVRKGEGYWTQRTYKPEDGTLTGIATGNISGSTVAGTVQNLSFVYDGLGNLTSRSDTLHSLSESFGYDNLNRLTQRNGTTIVSYQANGNIDWKYDVAGTKSAAYGYDDIHPHAVKSAWNYTMSYDANGNLKERSKTDEIWKTKWTGFDKPRWLAKNGTGSEFVYNAGRSRVLHIEFNTMAAEAPSHYTNKRIYAFGPTVENDYINNTGTGAPDWKLEKTRIYVPGPEGSIGTMEIAGNAKPGKAERALVYHYDHLGSIESITPFGDTSKNYAVDDTGLPSRYSYEAWGQRRDATGWSGVPNATAHGGKTSLTPRGFTGHEMLDDIGLVHMNGRIYDPLLGRFLSADVVVQAPSNLQAYNRYSYVMNNPLSKTDPSGFMETTISEEEAKKKKDSAPKINEVVNKAINKVFSELEKGKIKPEQAAGQLHSILNKGSDMYGNNTALSREVQKQGKDYVAPGKTDGSKYQGGLPVQEGASKEAEAKAGAVGKVVLEQGLARKNEDGKLVWKDSVSIAPGVNVDGKAVGTDKLDHVVDNGFNLFKAGFTRKEALTQSARDESGISGMTSTGVFSRGDIAANMVGFDLYSAVDTAARSGGSAPQFDITPSASKLDENINPNSYTTDVQALVDKNTQK